jgi:hypothetical protein
LGIYPGEISAFLFSISSLVWGLRSTTSLWYFLARVGHRSHPGHFTIFPLNLGHYRDY